MSAQRFKAQGAWCYKHHGAEGVLAKKEAIARCGHQVGGYDHKPCLSGFTEPSAYRGEVSRGAYGRGKRQRSSPPENLSFEQSM